MNKSEYTCKYQSDACSLSMRLFKGSGSGQSKQRVDGRDWLITLCNWWSNESVPKRGHPEVF